MALRVTKLRAIAIIVLALIISVLVYSYFDSRVTEDITKYVESESTHSQNELVSEVRSQDSPESDVSSSADGDASLGKFDSLVVPIRKGPSHEDPDVAAAYAGDPAALFDSLVKLGMAGNAVASFNLYGLLVNCNSSQKTEEELETAINRMHETRRIPNSAQHAVDDRFDPTAFETNIRKSFARCRAVPADSVQRRQEWLKRAAEDGYPAAIEQFGDSIVQSQPDKAFDEYERLWELGGAMGAFKLSKMFESGWDDKEPDLVKSAAYGFIATEYLLEEFDSIDNVYGSTIFEEMKRDHIAIQRNYLMRVAPG